MKKIAVVDIDNTLWQFCDVFYKNLKLLHENFPPVDTWTTPEFWQPYCSLQEFLAAVNTIHFDQDNPAYQPYPESRAFLLSLKEQGFHVIIASHRLAEARQPTERWLSRHHLPYDELHLSFDKTVLFNDAAVVVDDAPKTLEKALACGALGAGLLFPWNKAYVGNGFGLFQNLEYVLGYILKFAESSIQ
jgi:beta-phosphoglucomutase-like phosphatase (HAD superfamily)